MKSNQATSKREPEYQELMAGHSEHKGEIPPVVGTPPSHEANADPYTDPGYNQPPDFLETETSGHPHFSPEAKACIDECLRCHKACLSEAMNHYLKVGGPHCEPPHFRLLLSCAEVCQTSANLGLMSSPFHTALCAVCAQVCEACAKTCDEIEGMAHCAATCRRCAHSCSGLAQPAT